MTRLLCCLAGMRALRGACERQQQLLLLLWRLPRLLAGSVVANMGPHCRLVCAAAWPGRSRPTTAVARMLSGAAARGSVAAAAVGGGGSAEARDEWLLCLVIPAEAASCQVDNTHHQARLQARHKGLGNTPRHAPTQPHSHTAAD